MKQNILLMLLLVFALSGCGSKNETKAVADGKDTSELQAGINLDQLKADLDKQTVICGEAGLSCPSYSAKVAFWKRADDQKHFEMKSCSGSLYNGKYIITNSHCIPKEISRAGASCIDQIKVLFPTTKYNESDSAKCKKIIQVYDPSLDRPDIAVIELENVVPRDSIEIAKDAFVEGSNVTAYTMNPKDRDLGIIVKKTCSLSTDNAYFMNTSSSYAGALISGPACQIIDGNSGAALVNKNGKMIAAIFAHLDIPGFTELFAKNNINFTTKVPGGVVQNITCLNDIVTNSGTNCELIAPQASEFTDFINRAKQAQNLAGVDDSQIEYELTTNFKLKLREVAVPSENKGLTSFRENYSRIFF